MKEKYWFLIFIGGLWSIISGLAFHNFIWVIIGIILIGYGSKLRRLKYKNGGNLKWHLTKKQSVM